MTRRSTPVARKSILSTINVDDTQPPHRRPGGHPPRRAARHRLRLREPGPAAPHRRQRRPHVVVRPRRGRRPGPPGPAPGPHRTGRVGRRRPGVRAHQHHRRPPALPRPRGRRPRGARAVRGGGRAAVDRLPPRAGPPGVARARGRAHRRRGRDRDPARDLPDRRPPRRGGGGGGGRRRVARRPAPRHRAPQGPHDDHRVRPHAAGRWGPWMAAAPPDRWPPSCGPASPPSAPPRRG